MFDLKQQNPVGNSEPHRVNILENFQEIWNYKKMVVVNKCSPLHRINPNPRSRHLQTLPPQLCYIIYFHFLKLIFTKAVILKINLKNTPPPASAHQQLKFYKLLGVGRRLRGVRMLPECWSKIYSFFFNCFLFLNTNVD